MAATVTPTAFELEGPTTELLQTLIRNACVNDGSGDTGDETRTADTLTTYLEGAGLEVQSFTPRAGRDSIVARIEGTDPDDEDEGDGNFEIDEVGENCQAWIAYLVAAK